MAEDSEAVTDSFVDQAMTVWNRMLSHKEIAEVVLSMDFEFLSCSNPTFE